MYGQSHIEAVASTDPVVVFDTEWTSWPGFWETGWDQPGKYREIIQIGAVRLSRHDGLRESGSLSVLVKPVRNPVLSDYIVELTGITQQDIDDRALGLDSALAQFADFADGSPLMALGDDMEVLDENCALHNMLNPFTGTTFTNLRPVFASYLGQQPESFMSCELPQIFGFRPPGIRHQAVDDSRCIAEALRILKRNGVNF